MKPLLIFLSIALLCASAWFFVVQREIGENTPQLTQNIIHIGGVVYSLEIADTPDEHGKGLGGRENLATSTGMLFIFEKPSTYGFWMRDMRFPIDIGWLDDAFCLVYDVRNVSPETYPEIFSPPLPVRYVLEVNAGVFDSAEVTEGSCFEVFGVDGVTK